MSSGKNKMIARGVSGLVGLAAVAVAGGILLLLENQKNDDKNKNDLHLKHEKRTPSPPDKSTTLNSKQDDYNTENDEKNNHLEIGEEAKKYLKSLLSLHSNYHHVEDDNDDVSKLPSFTICSMDIEANLMYNILSYLPIEHILTIQTIDEKFLALGSHLLNNRKYLRSCARRGFYNRSVVWPWIVSQSIEGYNDSYIQKLFQWRQVETNELNTKELKDTYHALAKDIHRTFSNNRILNLSEQQQRQLQTLLGVYSLLDPEVGYVQGMNFIAGTIILAVDDELDAFGIFCQLMKRNVSPLNSEKISNDTEQIDHNDLSNSYSYCAGGRLSKTQQCGYGLRDMFTPSLPGCLVAMLEFEQLFEKYLPILYQHMTCEGLTIQSFASEWFITLYAYVLPLSITFRIYDLFLIDGWKILHRVGLAILSRAQNTLLTFALDEIMMYLKQFPDSGIFISREDEEEGDSFIEHALSFKVTNYDLHKYAIDLLHKTTS